MANTRDELRACPIWLLWETSHLVVQGGAIQAETTELTKLRKQNYESGEFKTTGQVTREGIAAQKEL